MYANSSPITSAQSGIHEHLAAVVMKHAQSEFKKPVMPYNREAFEASMATWRQAGSLPLILDAGCGVGLSTRHLASRFPGHFVIGVDQSADRLSRNTAWDGPPPSNFTCVRADLVDYWRLMLAANVRPEKHFLLYPNPWPKIGHLARRWHGHPIFPTIVALGGELECRSNWQIYIEEFASALSHLTGADVRADLFVTDRPITPFEKKYLDSGHRLWRCKTQLMVKRQA
ncbi:MAG TPA: methyltransferase domain-containing protein [Noviherbaspirillum sp.]|nr:methyltransferase domain-containing protein [Noviherbaspirillum sp.]